MKLSDGIFLAIAQLCRRRTRSFLCSLSVSVGVIAMMLIASLGMFGQEQLRQGLQSVGLSGLAVYVSQNAPGQALTIAQADKITQALPEVSATLPIKAKTGSYRTNQKNGSAVFLGVGEHLDEVMGLNLVAGHLPSQQDIMHGRRVAVIDSTLATKLYQRTNITGKTIRFSINNSENFYEIIGVITPQASILGPALGNIIPSLVYVPYGSISNEQDSVDQIFVQCVADADLEQTGEQITEFLSNRAQVAGEIDVQNVSGVIDSAESAIHIVTQLFLVVASISFLVAMLGVFSGMLSATHEKTSEIGIFMAIGARRHDIARIFLLQAVLICAVGGAGGILFATTALLLIRYVWGITLVLPLGFSAIVLGLSVICGALAGVVPAVWASKLHPVEAMRK